MKNAIKPFPPRQPNIQLKPQHSDAVTTGIWIQYLSPYVVEVIVTGYLRPKKNHIETLPAEPKPGGQRKFLHSEPCLIGRFRSREARNMLSKCSKPMR